MDTALSRLFGMVGHTHIIIDQIFGVITKRLRGKEILTPERLIENIDATMDANPKYNAKPVRWLRSVFDWQTWCKTELKVKPKDHEGVFKRQCLLDAEGKYKGMMDFVFTGNREAIALMQYREYPQFPLRPDGSPGTRVIHALPTSAPPLKQVQPFSKWGIKGAHTLQKTVSLYCENTSALRTEAEKKAVLGVWEKHIKEVPVGSTRAVAPSETAPSSERTQISTKLRKAMQNGTALGRVWPMRSRDHGKDGGLVFKGFRRPLVRLGNATRRRILFQRGIAPRSRTLDRAFSACPGHR